MLWKLWWELQKWIIPVFNEITFLSSYNTNILGRRPFLTEGTSWIHLGKHCQKIIENKTKHVKVQWKEEKIPTTQSEKDEEIQKLGGKGENLGKDGEKANIYM